jgi:quercetin dioxygenase-like cupin family protein
MQIARREAGVPSERRETAEHVTGGASWADPVLTGEGLSIYHVFFEPKARTEWHTHDRGQVLLVTSGEGIVRSRDGSGGTIAVGDTVFIDPGEEHWHGAAPDSYMLHIAISLGAPVWLGAVTDEEYGAG